MTGFEREDIENTAGNNRRTESDNPNADQDPERLLDENPLLAKELKQLFDGINTPPKPVEGEEPSPDNPEEDQSIDQLIGDFRLLRKVGAGGMARVFEAEQLSLKRRVAVKVLYSHLCLSEKAILKFQREAEASARQQHPGIVSIYAVGEYHGLHYIVEELVEDGRTLADELTQLKRMHGDSTAYYRSVTKIFSQIADALGYAHASGVIHRDIKPTNILITPSGVPKITDFGLARIEDAMILSRTGEFSGTPYYMSPEQAESNPRSIDQRSDVFSLGITLYEALTFKRPFHGKNSLDLLKKIVEEEPKSPQRENGSIPRDLSIICMKALEKARERRYQTMHAFANDLQRYLSGHPISARPVGPMRRAARFLHRHRTVSLLTVSACMLVLAIAMVTFQVNQDRMSREAEKALRFQPARQALGWSSTKRRSLNSTENWLLNTAPDHPATFLLMAVRLLEQNRENIRLREASLTQAVDHLRMAMSLFEDQAPPVSHLESDCGYLLGLALLRLSRAANLSDNEKDALSEESAAAIREARITRASDSLVAFEDQKEELWFERPIRLNTAHGLSHLYRGVDLFKDLYMGGERSLFEDSAQCFHEALKTYPHNPTALLCLGRLYFFMARFFEAYPLLDQAVELLEDRALTIKGSPRYYLNHVTLGQIEMMRGDLDKAEAQFQDALQCVDLNDDHIHNIYCNLGKISALRGKSQEALELLLKAHEIRSNDPHINLALGEYYLNQGKPEAAMRHAVMAEKRAVADAYLMMARIHMIEGNCKEAIKSLDKTASTKHIVPSARHRAMASLLLALIPQGDYGLNNDRETTAHDLAESACHVAAPDLPPICLSAMGVADLLNQGFSAAILNLTRARKLRSAWGSELLTAQWHEEARDLFLLAQAYTLRARSPDAEPDDEQNAMICFEEGEALVIDHFSKYMDMSEIILGLRDRTRLIVTGKSDISAVQPR